MKKSTKPSEKGLGKEKLNELLKLMENKQVFTSFCLDIDELEGKSFFVGIIFPLKVLKATNKDNKIYFELQIDNVLIDAIYEKSKSLDTEDTIAEERFIAFIEWQLFKHIDRIMEEREKS